MTNTTPDFRTACRAIMTKVGSGPRQFITLEIIRGRLIAYYKLHGIQPPNFVGPSKNTQLTALAKRLDAANYKICDEDYSGDPISTSAQFVKGYVCGPDLKQFFAKHLTPKKGAYIIYGGLVARMRHHLGDEMFEVLYGTDKNFGRHMSYQGIDTSDRTVDGKRHAVLLDYELPKLPAPPHTGGPMEVPVSDIPLEDGISGKELDAILADTGRIDTLAQYVAESVWADLELKLDEIVDKASDKFFAKFKAWVDGESKDKSASK